MILVNHFVIWPLIPKTIFKKHCRDEIIAFPLVLFHRDFFLNVCCLLRQQFSAAYLLKLFLLPQLTATPRFAEYRSMLQCVVVCCSVLQCFAVFCSVLQCFAVCCSVLQ